MGRKYFGNFHYQMGGDHALYYNLRLSEFLPWAVASPASLVKELDINLNPEIGKVQFRTDGEGEMSLDEYVIHPHHRVQGLLMAHKGKIVFEVYPGMNKYDHHIWMSAAKTTVGLVFSQLEVEGKIEVQRPVTDYVNELKDTNWDQVSVLNALNMSAALDLEETIASITDPASVIVRFFSAEFGEPVPNLTKIVHWLDVVKDAKRLDEKSGQTMRYSSANTTVLNYMAEKIENKSWIDIFQVDLRFQVSFR